MRKCWKHNDTMKKLIRTKIVVLYPDKETYIIIIKMNGLFAKVWKTKSQKKIKKIKKKSAFLNTIPRAQNSATHPITAFFFIIQQKLIEFARFDISWKSILKIFIRISMACYYYSWDFFRFRICGRFLSFSLSFFGIRINFIGNRYRSQGWFRLLFGNLGFDTKMLEAH